MTFTTYKVLAIALILTVSCKSDNALTVKTENRYELVDGKREVVEQVIKHLTKSDNKPISRLTRVFNYNSDVRIEQLTGLTKDKGLQDYLLDSIYYDSKGNDTLIVHFVHLGKWHRTQRTRKKFRTDNRIEHLITERDVEGRPDFKRERSFTSTPTPAAFFRRRNLSVLNLLTVTQCSRKRSFMISRARQTQ
jgi:hypothetical protein